jgi:hypothetical protein
VVSESPASAGREIFHFRCFEHRMSNRASRAQVGDAAPLGPLLQSPDREGGVTLQRNISTRKGVCRVEAVSETFVSPRGWSAAGTQKYNRKEVD